jgi:hypothetical protein
MENLDSGEKEFIQIISAFDFLFKEGYHGENFSIGGREPSITLQNWDRNRSIRIFWSEGGFLDVTITRKKIFAFNKNATFFSIRDFYKYFNSEYLLYKPPLGSFNQLKHNADFIQKHLMPVIRGEKWIDEIVRKNK